MDIRIDKLSEQLMIPPLTLQLLIENAVKHNKLQKDEPLRIELFTQPGNKLTVRNNLFKKDGKVESTGIGLQNINARYRMLGIPEAVIEKMDDPFRSSFR
jgi:LytS/YehU family sensor histidine kinase